TRRADVHGWQLNLVLANRWRPEQPGALRVADLQQITSGPETGMLAKLVLHLLQRDRRIVPHHESLHTLQPGAQLIVEDRMQARAHGEQDADHIQREGRGEDAEVPAGQPDANRGRPHEGSSSWRT